MPEKETDSELANRAEKAAKAALLRLVRKQHLAGWVDDESLTLSQLWRAVTTAMNDERAGFHLSPTALNNAALVLTDIDILRRPVSSRGSFPVGLARQSVARDGGNLIKELDEVTKGSAAPKTRYHETWPYFFLYAFPVVLVYLEWHGLPLLVGWVVLAASLVVAVVNFLVRYYSLSWFYERIGGRGFRVYPGP